MLAFARNLLPLTMPSVLHSDVNSPSHAATILLTMLFSRNLIYALSIPPTINSDSERYLTQLFTFLHFFYFLTLHSAGFTQKVSQLSLQASCASYFRHHNPELNPFPKLTFPKNRNWTNHNPISSSHILLKQNLRHSLISLSLHKTYPDISFILLRVSGCFARISRNNMRKREDSIAVKISAPRINGE